MDSIQIQTRMPPAFTDEDYSDIELTKIPPLTLGETNIPVPLKKEEVRIVSFRVRLKDLSRQSAIFQCLFFN
jgi:hypothetical protein